MKFLRDLIIYPFMNYKLGTSLSKYIPQSTGLIGH